MRIVVVLPLRSAREAHDLALAHAQADVVDHRPMSPKRLVSPLNVDDVHERPAPSVMSTICPGASAARLASSSASTSTTSFCRLSPSRSPAG